MGRLADAPPAAPGQGEGMPYLTNSLMPTASIDGYHAITAALPDARPPGMIARYVGVSDGGLAITVVWTSKADADRFETEQLIPTVNRLMGAPQADNGSTYYAYEAVDVVYGSSETVS
jgi:hypothetical protein